MKKNRARKARSRVIDICSECKKLLKIRANNQCKKCNHGMPAR